MRKVIVIACMNWIISIGVKMIIFARRIARSLILIPLNTKDNNSRPPMGAPVYDENISVDS